MGPCPLEPFVFCLCFWITLIIEGKMTFSTLLQRLEVKPTDDEFESLETSRWGNRDVYPVAHDKRTYGVYAFVSYWGMCFSSSFFLWLEEGENEEWGVGWM